MNQSNQNPTKVKVEIFSSPGCSKCGKAKDVLLKVIAGMNKERIEWRMVNILQEMDYALNIGVFMTPAIAIDGELAFSGLPSARKLKAALEDKLFDNNNSFKGSEPFKG